MNLVNEHLWVVYQSVISKKVEIREAICLWNDPSFRAPNTNWSVTKFGVIAFHFVDSEDVIVAKDVCKEYMWVNFYPESPFYAFFLTKEEADAFYDRIPLKKLSKIVESKRFNIGDTYYTVDFSSKDGYYVHTAIIRGFGNKKGYINTSIGSRKVKNLYKSLTTAKREAKRKNKRKLEELSNEYAKYILEHKVAKPVKKLEMGESYYRYSGRGAMKPIFVSSNGLNAIMNNGEYFNIGFGLENDVLYSTPPSYNDGEFKQKIRNYKKKINKLKELLKK